MALINCPACNARMSDKATRCSHCGVSRSEAGTESAERAVRELVRQKQRKTQMWRLLAMLLFVAGAGLTVLSGGGKSLLGVVGTSLAALGFVGYSALRVHGLFSKRR